MKENSIKRNTILNTIRTAASVLFPLVTYPYVTRILSVEGIGIYNFGNSIVSYMLLIGGFGIRDYAIRTGAQIRDDKEKLQKFACQMFSLNFLLSVVAYLLLFVLTLVCNDKIFNNVIFVQGLTILLVPFSLDWFYIIQEDFQYITFKSLIAQLLSAILLFTLVKQPEDLYEYAFVIVFSNSFSNIANYIYSRKYMNIKFTYHMEISKYVSNLFVFFINSVAAIIMMNSDITLLGIICDKRAVGLYSIPVKVITIVKQLFNGLVVTVMPGMSYYYVTDRDKFLLLLKRMISMVSVFIVPVAVGVFLLREEIILIISGKKYLEAKSALGILAFVIYISVLANIFCNCVLTSRGQEKVVARATLLSASVNIILNIIILKGLQQNGAALTTVIAESIVLVISLIGAKDLLKKVFSMKVVKDIIVGNGISIIMFCILRYFLDAIGLHIIVRCLFLIAIYIFIYGTVMLFLKNETMIYVIKESSMTIRKVILKYRH